jgi:hypothetical protein
MARSLVQEREILRRFTPWKRTQECVDVSGVLVRQDIDGISRHVVRCLAQKRDERFNRQLQFRKRWCRIVHCAALSGAAVALKTTIREIDALSVGRGRLIRLGEVSEAVRPDAAHGRGWRGPGVLSPIIIVGMYVRRAISCRLPQPAHWGCGEPTRRCQRSTPTEMLRPISWAIVAVCANSFANAGSFATPSCALP